MSGRAYHFTNFYDMSMLCTPEHRIFEGTEQITMRKKCTVKVVKVMHVDELALHSYLANSITVAELCHQNAHRHQSMPTFIRART